MPVWKGLKPRSPAASSSTKSLTGGSLIGWLNMVQRQADPDLYLEENKPEGGLARFRPARRGNGPTVAHQTAKKRSVFTPAQALRVYVCAHPPPPPPPPRVRSLKAARIALGPPRQA